MYVSRQIRFRLQLALLWLFTGCAAALALPVSIGTPRFGWTVAYWLLIAPILMLLFSALRPAQSRPRRITQQAARPLPCAVPCDAGIRA